MLANYLEKVKQWIRENGQDLFIAAVIFLVGLSSFGLGRLSALVPKKEPIVIESQEVRSKNQGKYEDGQGADISSSLDSKFLLYDSAQGRYVASKNGEVYHFPWCSGAQRIKEENKIWFQTKEEAESRGYHPAGNCEGL